jgi:XTP/dITP diphosphohydrolase
MSGLVLCVATRNRHKLDEIAALLSGPDLAVQLTSCLDHPGCPEVQEDGETLEENAAKKAREVCAFTGLVTLADDTGLEVEALAGAPGVRSARYAGEGCSYADNVAKLLRELGPLPDERRSARFRCVVALATPLSQEGAGTGGVEDLSRSGAGREARPESGRPDPDRHGSIRPAAPAWPGEGTSRGGRPRQQACTIELFEGRIEGRIARAPRGRGGFGYDPVFFLPEAGCSLAELDLESKNAVSHRGRALARVREVLRQRYGERGGSTAS